MLPSVSKVMYEREPEGGNLLGLDVFEVVKDLRNSRLAVMLAVFMEVVRELVLAPRALTRAAMNVTDMILSRCMSGIGIGGGLLVEAVV